MLNVHVICAQEYGNMKNYFNTYLLHKTGHKNAFGFIFTFRNNFAS